MYQWTTSARSHVCDGSRRSIPADEANGDWRAVLAWVAAGNTIAEPDPVPVPPHLVAKTVVIRRLQEAGKFAAALAALKADPLTYELWSAVPALASDNPDAIALFQAIGVDPAVILAP